MHTLLHYIRKKRIAIPACFLLFYLLSGFFLLPVVLKHFAPKIIEDKLNCKVILEKVNLNPLTFALELDNFALKDPKGIELLKFKRFLVDLGISSIARWALTFDQVTLEEPSVRIAIAPDGQSNFAALVPASPESPPAETTSLPRIWIDNLAVFSGGIHITDQRPQQPAELNLTGLEADFSQITALAGLDGYGTLSARLETGTTLNWKGSILLSPPASNGIIQLSNVKLRSLFAFVQDQVNTEPPNGHLNLELAYRVGLKENGLQLNLSDLKATLNNLDLKLKGEKKPLLQLAKIELNQGKFDYPAGKLAIEQINLKKGWLHVDQRRDGTLNLTHLTNSKPSNTKDQETNSEKSTPAVPFDLNIAQFSIKDMEVLAEDNTLVPAAQIHVKRFGLDTAVSASLDLNSPQVTISKLNMAVDQITAGFAKDQKPILNVDQVALTDGNLNLADQRLSLSKLHVKGGGVNLVRSAQGDMEVIQKLSPKQTTTPVSPKQSAAPVAPVEETKAQKPWQWSVHAIEIEDFESNFLDKAVDPEIPVATLKKIRAKLTDVNGGSPFSFEFGFALKQGGYADVSGKINPKLPAVETNVEIYSLNLTPLQPYVKQLAHATLASGVFSTQGKLQYGFEDQPAQARFQGKMMVDNLNVTDAETQSNLISWKRLKTTGLEVLLEPNELTAKDMTLVKPNGRLLIAKDGSINFSNTLEALSSPANENQQIPPAATPPAAVDDSAAFPIKVDRLRLLDGELDFADKSLTPSFFAKIHQLKGSITGISLAPDVRAKIELDGQVDKYGVSKIKGELSPTAPKEFTDIGMQFKNVEMASLSPYTGKFAGRKIDSGKLSMDLKYNIEDSRLLGDNQIIVEKLTLGQKVNSPNAANLPLDLAIALLEDENGVIDLGIPVKGDLNDPQFNYTHLIWETLRKQIYKVASSPFRALSSLFKNKNDAVGTIGFEPGQAALTPPEKEKLTELGRALKARPQLSLTVTGRFNPQKDGLYFKDLKLRTLIAKLQDLELEHGEDPGPLNFANPDVQKIITDLFEDQFGSKTFDDIKASMDQPRKTKEKELTNEQEEELRNKRAIQLAKVCFKRLRENQKFDDKMLTKLAEKRSQTILSQLTGPNGITSQRLNIAPPVALSPDAPISSALTLAVLKNQNK